jgi:MFS family permease
MYGRSALGPLQESLQASLGLTDNQIAWLQGPALAIPMVAGAVPLALAIDRFSKARILKLAVLAVVAASAVSAFSSDLLLLAATRCVVGAALTAALIASYALVGDLFAPEQRGRATTIVALGEICGAPAAFAMGGFFVSRPALLGFVEGLEPWQAGMLGMSIALVPLLALALMWRTGRQTGPAPISRRDWPETLRAIRAAWPIIGPLLLARIMVWIADGAVFVWAAPSYTRRFGLAPDVVGAYIALALLISGLAGPLLGGPLADLCHRLGGPRRTAMAAALFTLLAVPVAFFPLAPSPQAATVMLTLFLIFGFTFGTIGLALSIVVVPAEIRSLYLAISVAVAALFSTGLAPLLVSSLATWLGGTDKIGVAMASVCAITSFAGAIVFFSTRNRFAVHRQAGLP